MIFYQNALGENMKKKDLKKYAVFLPIRWEHESIFAKIEELIPGYCKNIFRAYWLDRYSLKIFYGEKQVVRIPEKDGKTFRYIPLSIWMKLGESLDDGILDDEIWSWVKQERSKLGIVNKIKTKSNSLLDL